MTYWFNDSLSPISRSSDASIDSIQRFSPTIVRFVLFVAIGLAQPAGTRFAHGEQGWMGKLSHRYVGSLEQMQLALDGGELLTEEELLLFRQTFVNGSVNLLGHFGYGCLFSRASASGVPRIAEKNQLAIYE